MNAGSGRLFNYECTAQRGVAWLPFWQLAGPKKLKRRQKTQVNTLAKTTRKRRCPLDINEAALGGKENEKSRGRAEGFEAALGEKTNKFTCCLEFK